MATDCPAFARIVGVLPAHARPLMHSKFARSPVTGGGNECMNSTCSTSGAGAPFSRTMIEPNRPRAVLIVALGPWSWYGQTPTEFGRHSHVYLTSSPGAMKPPARV